MDYILNYIHTIALNKTVSLSSIQTHTIRLCNAQGISKHRRNSARDGQECPLQKIHTNHTSLLFRSTRRKTSDVY